MPTPPTPMIPSPCPLCGENPRPVGHAFCTICANDMLRDRDAAIRNESFARRVALMPEPDRTELLRQLAWFRWLASGPEARISGNPVPPQSVEDRTP